MANKLNKMSTVRKIFQMNKQLMNKIMLISLHCEKLESNISKSEYIIQYLQFRAKRENKIILQPKTVTRITQNTQ